MPSRVKSKTFFEDLLVKRFLTVRGGLFLYTPGVANQLELGGPDSTNTYIDLTADSTYADYGMRLLRSSGANGNSTMYHRGTGALLLAVQDAGSMQVSVNGTTRLSGSGSAPHSWAIGGPFDGDSLRVVTAVNVVERLEILGKTAGGAPELRAAGASADLDIALTPKGSGYLRFGAFTSNADAPVTGYVTIRTGDGTLRKLAVIA